MTEKHSILGGKVHVYKRPESPIWQCSTYMSGRNRRISTKESSLQKAKDFAEDWYLELRGKKSQGELPNEKTFNDATKVFEAEYEIMTEGERNARYVADHKARLRNHLKSYFGKKGLLEITAGLVQEYRVHRLQTPPREDKNRRFKTPTRTTLHSEIVTLRQVLKMAMRKGWLESLPDLSMPYRQSSKISHRAWFSPEEYKRLYTATRDNAKNAVKKPWRWSAEQLHDKVLFLANTGIRPDEATWLEYRDIAIVDDADTSETILEIEVRGKRGVGFCKSMPGAVMPFKRMVARNDPEPTDRVFPVDHKRQFNRILDAIDLKFDRSGNRRTLYSLRHSYISFRLLEGADIYQVAKNCRTSVEMIEKHYAVHLKNQIDAAKVNVRRGR